MSSIPLAGLLPHEINEKLGFTQSFRGKQIFKWVQKGVMDINGMTDLPVTLRKGLAEKVCLATSGIDSYYREKNLSCKLRIKLEDGNYIETVLLIDNQGRRTACLSSQAGCAMGCAFCKTACMGFRRNLSVHEIVEQVHHLVFAYGEISHIVFMGMGEPLLNLEEVRKAIDVLHHPVGKHISLRKITISTCGIIKGIEDIVNNGPHVRLAVSLVTADDDVRKNLMPAAMNNSLKKLKKAMGLYQEKTRKWITFELVLIHGVTDRKKDIKKLIAFIPPLKALVNIIPWNPAPGLPFKRPGSKRINWFIKKCEDAGIVVTQRYRKGSSIHAACGQLFVE